MPLAWHTEKGALAIARLALGRGCLFPAAGSFVVTGPHLAYQLTGHGLSTDVVRSNPSGIVSSPEVIAKAALAPDNCLYKMPFQMNGKPTNRASRITSGLPANDERQARAWEWESPFQQQDGSRSGVECFPPSRLERKVHMKPGGVSSRRGFLTASAGALGTAWFATCWPAIAAAHDYAQRLVESGQRAFDFFSPEQGVEVEAMVAQIIPTDDTPGAREAQVIYFIDRALTTFERDKQPLYTQGLAELPFKVGQLFPGQNKFSAATEAQQVQVLTAMEQSEFFEIVRAHTIAGFFANPEYGGNRNQIGWKLIAFENRGVYEPPFGYYDREENKRK